MKRRAVGGEGPRRKRSAAEASVPQEGGVDTSAGPSSTEPASSSPGKDEGEEAQGVAAPSTEPAGPAEASDVPSVSSDERGDEDSRDGEAGGGKRDAAPFGTPVRSTPPKVAGGLGGGGKRPLATAEMGLGQQFGGWSSRSARLLAVYVRQHYKQARQAEWRAMAQTAAGDDEGGGGGSSSARRTHTLANQAAQDGDGTAAARSLPLGPGPTVIDMDTDEINDDLSCPICLGVIRKAVTTIECLHRFCTECIEKSLRLGQKECPTCRERCPSRRFLRPDPNFDALIGE